MVKWSALRCQSNRNTDETQFYFIHLKMLSNYSKHWLSLLFVFACSKIIIHAQVLKPGSCPNPSVMSNFDVDQYSGKWYNNRNYFSIAQMGLDCLTTTYTNQGNVMNITIEGLKLNSTKPFTAIGKGLVVSPGRMTVSFFENAWTSGSENHLILDTDYTSYAVVWSCLPLGIAYLSLAWVLTREPNPPDATIETALAVFQKNKIDAKKLKIVNQEYC